MLWMKSTEPDDIAFSDEDTDNADVMIPNQDAVHTPQPVETPVEPEPAPVPAAATVADEAEASAPQKPAAPVQECLISNGSTVKGDMETSDNVLLAGHLEGNLTSSGTVCVTGSIQGDIRAQCVELIGGSVGGNIVATEIINIDKAGTVMGNLKANAINLKTGTSVTGDITGATVCMAAGAALHGKLDITG